VKGREWRAAHDDDKKMIVPFIQPLKNIEDEVAIRDSTAEVGHAFHLVTVVTHREVTLDKVLERGIEVKRAHFTVADELVLDHAPDLVRSDVVLLGDVLKLIDDRGEDPGEDIGLHAIPGRVIDGRSAGEDVVDEFVALQGEQNLITPPGVACRSRI
jgi:hypothetical protein